jgi:hypothetical protein
VTNIRNVLGVKVAPTISGTASLGKALTVKNGSWNATGTFTYQWLRDGEVLSGENDSTYVPEQADAGHRLSVTLRHQKSGYYDTFYTTVLTAVVSGGFMSGVFVQLSGLVGGVPKVGTALGLTCSWTPSGGALSYSWKVGGKVVATTPNYAPRASDVGKTVTVTQTQVKVGFTTASVSFTSGPTAR